MQRFLVPPEALEPTEPGALPTTKKKWVLTVEGVTLISILTLTVSVTAGVTFLLAPVILPCTAFVAYGFWRVGRRIKTPNGILLYCFAGGALAGAINVWLTIFFWSMFSGSDFLGYLGLGGLAGMGIYGAILGIGYGFAYLFPMLIQRSARSLRRTEGVDRCLVSYGIWGVLVLGVGFALIVTIPHAAKEMPDLVFLIAGASFLLHAGMLILGTLRWVRRRSWLARVLRGQIPLWRVCEAQRFHAAELEGLQGFGSPLFAPPPEKNLRVLAWGDGTEAYRSTPLTPKYFVR